MKRKLHFYFLLFLIIVGCSEKPNSSNAETRLFDDYYMKAIYIGDSIADGEVTYYNLDKVLIARATFKNGVKHGQAVGFYENGRIKDSLYYKNGLLDGRSILFDSSGLVLATKYSYYGLDVGHRYKYYAGNLRSYSFADFDKNVLVDAKYDTSERPELSRFNIAPSFIEAVDSQFQPSLQVLLYFPTPPGYTIEYSLGVENDLGTRVYSRKLAHDNQLFVDTVLSSLEDSLHYFFQAEMKGIVDSTRKVYLYELRTDN